MSAAFWWHVGRAGHRPRLRRAGRHDPDHVGQGLGRAVVLEAPCRAAAAGAEVAWVGSDQPFYRSLGFEEMFASTLWIRG